MAKFDRYMLSQLLVLFGFFALVLVAVFWINRAVALFDRLIGDGQTALVFLEFTALGLPKLITTVLPLATFAAAVYVTNRLTNESELTVMQAIGTGPWRLARPVFLYGVISALMMSVLTHVLVPSAQAQLNEREAEVSRNVTARLLTEGTFLHPVSGVTFYTRAISEDGVLQDVFLADRRDPLEHVMYTAAESYLVRNDIGTTLIMVDGLAQRLTTDKLSLSTGRFQDFAFDISALVNTSHTSATSIRYLPTLNLIRNWSALSDMTRASPGEIAEEVHSRFATSLFCIVAAMIGFSTLLLGGFSRFGVWREIGIAFLLLIFIDGLHNVVIEPVIRDSINWPMMYIPALVGFLLSTAMLTHATRPNWWKRRIAT